MKTIVLTGGGTAGHVTPNLALLPALAKEGYAAVYIGGRNGIEKKLAASAGLEFYGISSGKLRRYIDPKNLTDAFRVVKGVADASAAIGKIKPDVVFSKGGFVSVPVCLAAFLHGAPVVIHESDLTPGLANRLSFPFCKAACVSFPETLERLPRRFSKDKSVYTGAPVRRELFFGNREKGRVLCGFEGKKPVVLFAGGSSGSVRINKQIRAALGELTRRYDVVHLCGRGNAVPANKRGYAQFEYLNEELPHVLALADVAVSRAGSGAIFELLALGKPMLLIPLSKKASRGDQILNAESFQKQGFALVLKEEDMNAQTLLDGIQSVYENRFQYASVMKEAAPRGAVEAVVGVIKRFTR